MDDPTMELPNVFGGYYRVVGEYNTAKRSFSNHDCSSQLNLYAGEVLKRRGMEYPFHIDFYVPSGECSFERVRIIDGILWTKYPHVSISVVRRVIPIDCIAATAEKIGRGKYQVAIHINPGSQYG